ncbi:unnamed protein product [Parascedosporium putredinis]|uniref:chitinase n=1 Tax=Parascedosporium putredinis TaxID=1442378 RepID=A0A9P1H2L2_9PEZI|nr:unnamed protein product [Parascedosporium putredinis]CAI7996188.1 unnamed protein product [Parascedosporium putredinis]
MVRLATSLLLAAAAPWSSSGVHGAINHDRGRISAAAIGGDPVLARSFPAAAPAKDPSPSQRRPLQRRRQPLPRPSTAHQEQPRDAPRRHRQTRRLPHTRSQAGQGDCALLATLCGISGADFTKYNAWRPDMCSTLMPGDKVCCSAGDPPPKPEPPKRNGDGSCAAYVVEGGDTCSGLAGKFGVTIKDLDQWNAKKTWGWVSCEAGLMKDYTICLSEGDPPLPTPQDGAACGPTMPGTVRPAPGISLADLNPCPLNACCSNWGFCGPFEAHCAVHSPGGDAGPGAVKQGARSTCVSNCERDIKNNSGPPASFSRVGYYQALNLERECLHLRAKNANIDDKYTHMQWAFAEIDSETLKPVIKDPYEQWDDFKSLQLKRIVSFGGWVYSTESATSDVIRRAILEEHETFAENIAQFLEDEGIDGVDIDLEYSDASDVFANGPAIGQEGDGDGYLRFLATLKEKVGKEKSVSIAAPGSFWYLQKFPIDRIARVVDYIVYMTYDFHGQWDYGNADAFDSCDSGRCIRSHVNLTETVNSLSIITKAGVPNNKIYVGEASYGRSVHMAKDGCWEPMCEFTGSRNKSDALPGRCTKDSGYLANAEIAELIEEGSGRSFHDADSDTDILLYKGDYVAYMSETTKETRRAYWKELNFAGTVDWAVDLQSFTADAGGEGE